MATRDTAFNITDGLKWLAGAMGIIIMALSGFSSQQVLKTIEKAEQEKNKLKDEQDAINKAITVKLDNISQQLSDQRSDNRIIQSELTELKIWKSEAEKRITALEFDKARNGR